MTIQEANKLLEGKVKIQIELIKHLEDQIKQQNEYIELLKNNLKECKNDIKRHND